MVGSLGNLYQSVENLNMNYMQPNIDKDVLLKPSSTASMISSSGTLGLLPATNHVDDSIDDPETLFYMCPINCSAPYLTCDSNTRCRSCGRYMTPEMNFIGSKVAVENNSIKSGLICERHCNLHGDGWFGHPSHVNHIKYHIAEQVQYQSWAWNGWGKYIIKYIPLPFLCFI